MAGLFISFEGIDNSGKSTQAKLLVEYLQRRGYDVVATYEPGGTELGKKIRPLVLNTKTKEEICVVAEMFLFAADRAQHVNELIRPALDKGKVVISDRYIDSTLAYQGYGRESDLKKIKKIQDMVTDGLKPAITVWLDVDSQAIQKRDLPLFSDRIESKDKADKDFFFRVQKGFAEVYESEPNRIFRVDGTRSIKDVFKDVKRVVDNQIMLRNLYKINLKDWVLGTIKKVEGGADWHSAWYETYRSLGGKSKDSGTKNSPMKGTEVLYRLGRIKGSGLPFRNPGLRDIWDYSKNGTYAILALEYLKKKPDILRSELWSKIQERIRCELCEEPAKKDQGALKVAFMLWHLDLIIHNPNNSK